MIQQEQVEKLRNQEEQERSDREAAAKRAESERLIEEETQRQRDIQERGERERQERDRQYEQTRLVERQAREAAQRADQEWLAGIQKGHDGVREQLNILLKATENDTEARRVAIASLHTLFKQIASKPEEVAFRRIRRDHEKFNADIGRHPGGKEILIASGFELGAIDDVPCFISKEPSIENDMDGWSCWFDLLKAALCIIEEHL